MGTYFTSQRCRWIARTLAVAEFLLWGAFFIEHLTWFSELESAMPPKSIWFQQFAHLAFLIGYLSIWKWEKLGAIIILLGALAFFPFVGGPNAWWFLLFAISPAIFLFLAWRNEESLS